MLHEESAVRQQERARTQEDLGSEVDRLAINTVAMAAGLVGAWTLARIVSAMIATGGPLGFVKAWWSAVSGM